jgi:hypothetical protein
MLSIRNNMTVLQLIQHKFNHIPIFHNISYYNNSIWHFNSIKSNNYWTSLYFHIISCYRRKKLCQLCIWYTINSIISKYFILYHIIITLFDISIQFNLINSLNFNILSHNIMLLTRKIMRILHLIHHKFDHITIFHKKSYYHHIIWHFNPIQSNNKFTEFHYIFT